VQTADVLDDNLMGEDILDGEIRAIDVAFGTLRGDEIQDGTLGGVDIVDDGLGGEDVNESTLFNDNSLTTADLANDSVGKGELGPDSVGASEVGPGQIIAVLGTAVTVNGGAEGNGDVNINQATASCDANQELVGAYGEWTDNTTPSNENQQPGDEELYTMEVSTTTANETVTAIGANDTDNNHTYRAVALCLVP
jgi:hypothetical protein